MTRRNGCYIAVLLLLSLLCGCTRPAQAVAAQSGTAQATVSAPQEDHASAEEVTAPKGASEEAPLPEASPVPEEEASAEASLPEEPLPLTEEGAMAIAEAESAKAIYPRWSAESVFEASYAEYYDLEAGATLPWPGGPVSTWTTEAGVQAFTWKEGEFPDEDYGHLTSSMRIWCVRLCDSVDPLNSLFVYLNADTGELLGACRISD